MAPSKKRPTFPPRHESPEQSEEREARVTEILERITHHNEQADVHQQRVTRHQEEAKRHIDRAAKKKTERQSPRSRKRR